MKTIKLIHGGEAIVSDEDFDKLAQHEWRGIQSKPGYVYACRNEPKTGRRIRMHREVCPPARGQVVDHINGNTLDNRRENLRAVSNAENMHNRHKPTQASSGHRNVYRHRDGYVVKAVRFGQLIYGGRFLTLEEAIEARDRMAAIVAPTQQAWGMAA